MSKVLLDNWLLFNCLNSKLFDNKYPSYRYRDYDSMLVKKDAIENCWQTFISSLVLWDEVYFNTNDEDYTSYRRDYLYGLINDLLVENNHIHVLDRNLIPIYEPDVETARKLFDEIRKEESDRETIRLLFRGYLYLLDANSLGFNYLPHPYRAKVFLESNIMQKGFFNAKDIVDRLDDDIISFIDEINKKFKRPIIPTKFPVLYQYIHQNACSPQEELSLALSLRNKKTVNQFRESVNDIENRIREGNYIELIAALKTVDEVCNEVAYELYREPHKVNVSLGLSLNPSISASTDINIPEKFKSKLHTTFLFDLTKFAIKDNKHRF